MLMYFINIFDIIIEISKKKGLGVNPLKNNKVIEKLIIPLNWKVFCNQKNRLWGFAI